MHFLAGTWWIWLIAVVVVCSVCFAVNRIIRLRRISKFRRLLVKWSKETAYMSSVSDMSNHPAYQEIIKMGKPAVPLLLKELQKEPDHLFWALHAITGEKPVPEEHAGKIGMMAEDWIEWGKRKGYI